MRTIRFRGKSSTSGEWKFGCLWLHNEQALIIPSPLYDEDEEDQNVILETVGQFTGLTDREGNEVYEDDLVEEYVMGDIFQVVFTDYGNFGLKPVSKKAAELLKGHEYETIDPSYACTSLTVVGNVFDNPDLLK